MSDIEIEIDGKVCSAKANAMVIQVADEAGIYIPRFCYHKHLSIAANCRMCLVEVEKSPKALPACATPVMPGMKVFTKSPKALAAQKAVMEFLLINHPLDCPICDQGGQCELQDLSMGFGASDSKYDEGKRAVKDKDIGPLIETVMTRCIHCTRCVRFGAEVAGMRELGATGRGEHMEIGTYIEHAMKSEVSGNVIDICPVGALTSKPFRYTARAWELQQYTSIASHDCVGSNLNIHTRTGKVMRVVPRENRHINETWISDRDRFSYEGLYHADRLQKPLLKKNGVWHEVEWPLALEAVTQGLQKVIEKSGPEQIGALASPNSTTEEFYLLQKLLRTLGSSHIDHRLRQVDFADDASAPLAPVLPFPLVELQSCDVILLVGSNIQQDQPIAGLHIRKATLNHAYVAAINPIDYAFHFTVAAKHIVSPSHIAAQLAAIVKAVHLTTEIAPVSLRVQLDAIVVSDKDAEIAAKIVGGQKVCIVLGNIATQLEDAATVRELARVLTTLPNVSLAIMTDGANAAGAWRVGAIPHRQINGQSITSGLNAQSMLQHARKAYLLMNVEPEVDCANPPLIKQALEQADFVVALSLYKNTVLQEHADVILPMTPPTETSGTFVNVAGNWQTFKGSATAFGESRPAWKILRVMGNLLHCEGFDFVSNEEVLAELKAQIENSTAPEFVSYTFPVLSTPTHNTLYRVGEVPLYSVDSIVRRSSSLAVAQAILVGEVAVVRMHPDTAHVLHLEEGRVVNAIQAGQHVSLPLVFDARVAKDSVVVASGIHATQALEASFGEIAIQL